MPRRRAWTPLWGLGALASLAGAYSGVVLAMLGWGQGGTDINGDPVSLFSRVVWVATGFVLLIVSVYAGYRLVRRRWGARRLSR